MLSGCPGGNHPPFTHVHPMPGEPVAQEEEPPAVGADGGKASGVQLPLTQIQPGAGSAVVHPMPVAVPPLPHGPAVALPVEKERITDRTTRVGSAVVAWVRETICQ